MERRFRFNQLSSILSGAMDTYNSIDALMAPVRMGALAPVSGKFLLKLAAQAAQGNFWPRGVPEGCCFWAKSGGGRLKRRQELPDEAFFVPTAEQLAAITHPDYKKRSFVALSYRWLSKGTERASTACHMDPCSGVPMF